MRPNESVVARLFVVRCLRTGRIRKPPGSRTRHRLPMRQARYNPPPLPGAVMLSDKTTEHICRLVDDSPPFTDDDLASLSTILRPEPLNVAAKFPTQSLTNRLRCNNSHSTASACRRTTPARTEP